MSGPARAGALSTLLLGAMACNPFALPGLGALPTPPADAIEPEPVACGALRERPVVTIGDPKKPIIGAADYHNHQFADLGFGGSVLWGTTHDPRGMSHALSKCGAEGLCIDERERFICRAACHLSFDMTACRRKCDEHACSESTPHGHFGVADPVNMVLSDTPGHHVDGWPNFRGWPHWNTYTHQQVYHRWLRRAFDGGLKLIVMHAVTNEALCRFMLPDHPCDDMSNVDRQIRAAYELEDTIDYENDCNRDNNNGWYRIARSPEHARAIIAGGAMAVVLAMEVDTPFNCYKRKGQPCTQEEIKAAIKTYRGYGVSHLFPVHLFDNAFGATAASEDFFNFGNVVINHDLIGVRDCASKDYAFQFDMSDSVRGVLSMIASKLGVSYPEYPEKDAHCNSNGLAPLGEIAIRELMKAGIIIDVDHMSEWTRKRTFEIAKELAYPGLVSSHTGFTQVALGQKKHEGQLTEEETKTLLSLGGLLAPILSQGSKEQVDTYEVEGRTTIQSDCGDSAKSFAQAYRYAVDFTREHRKDPVTKQKLLLGVGFGSDLNGLAGLPTPRFGPYACGGEKHEEQHGRVNYPIPLYKLLGVVPFGEPMPQSQAGYRVFDINVDGFAHVGMFPDFVAELETIGLRDELEPLFNSAEAYIQLWEAAEKWARERPEDAGPVALRSR